MIQTQADPVDSETTTTTTTMMKTPAKLFPGPDILPATPFAAYGEAAKIDNCIERPNSVKD